MTELVECQYSYSRKIFLTVLHESCRFEIHTSRLQWDSANQACIQRGLTLASLADISEVDSLVSVIKQADSVYSNRFGLESR